jgi:modulator of FtsH protease HflK
MKTQDQQMQELMRRISKNIGKVLLILGLVIIAATSTKTVGPEEEGVVLQMGRYNRTVNPGLNFILPIGIEKMYKIPVQRQLKQEFGFRTMQAGTRTQYTKAGYSDESLC